MIGKIQLNCFLAQLFISDTTTLLVSLLFIQFVTQLTNEMINNLEQSRETKSIESSYARFQLKPNLPIKNPKNRTMHYNYFFSKKYYLCRLHRDSDNQFSCTPSHHVSSTLLRIGFRSSLNKNECTTDNNVLWKMKSCY